MANGDAYPDLGFWGQLKNVVGQGLGDLLLLPALKGGQLPQVLMQRQLAGERPEARPLLATHPFLAGLEGYGTTGGRVDLPPLDPQQEYAQRLYGIRNQYLAGTLPSDTPEGARHLAGIVPSTPQIQDVPQHPGLLWDPTTNKYQRLPQEPRDIFPNTPDGLRRAHVAASIYERAGDAVGLVPLADGQSVRLEHAGHPPGEPKARPGTFNNDPGGMAAADDLVEQWKHTGAKAFRYLDQSDGRWHIGHTAAGGGTIEFTPEQQTLFNSWLASGAKWPPPPGLFQLPGTAAPTPAPTTTPTETTTTLPTRLNNPGSIKRSDLTASLPGVVGTHPASDGGEFLQFDTPAAGKQAIKTLLTHPQGGYRDLPLGHALFRWSGGGYGGKVAAGVGLDPNRTVASLQPDEIDRLVGGIANAEGYQEPRTAAATPTTTTTTPTGPASTTTTEPPPPPGFVPVEPPPSAPAPQAPPPLPSATARAAPPAPAGAQAPSPAPEEGRVGYPPPAPEEERGPQAAPAPPAAPPVPARGGGAPPTPAAPEAPRPQVKLHMKIPGGSIDVTPPKEKKPTAQESTDISNLTNAKAATQRILATMKVGAQSPIGVPGIYEYAPKGASLVGPVRSRLLELQSRTFPTMASTQLRSLESDLADAKLYRFVLSGKRLTQAEINIFENMMPEPGQPTETFLALTSRMQMNIDNLLDVKKAFAQGTPEQMQAAEEGVLRRNIHQWADENGIQIPDSPTFEWRVEQRKDPATGKVEMLVVPDREMPREGAQPTGGATFRGFVQ